MEQEQVNQNPATAQAASNGLALEMFGFTREELQDRVVDQLCSQVMHGKIWNEDGEDLDADSTFARKLRESVEKQINTTIEALAAKHVLPNVAAYIENLTLQETTKWGEKKGEPLTFIQYLVQRAEAYMNEQVNYEGKSKGEADSYSWTGKQSRITHLIHKHLHYSIETAMKDALAIANTAFTRGIEETAKIKLAEMSTALKVAFEVKSK